MRYAHVIYHHHIRYENVEALAVDLLSQCLEKVELRDEAYCLVKTLDIVNGCPPSPRDLRTTLKRSTLLYCLKQNMIHPDENIAPYRTADSLL